MSGRIHPINYCLLDMTKLIAIFSAVIGAVIGFVFGIALAAWLGYHEHAHVFVPASISGVLTSVGAIVTARKLFAKLHQRGRKLFAVMACLAAVACLICFFQMIA
jgi:O-antigen/teichoic acid export membrane protein